MLDTNDAIALTAFIFSLIALSFTLLQLLQQYFATAEGYRRCSRRFIGDWSRFRHRHYLWHEFRFEVAFVRPHIYLGYPGAKPSEPVHAPWSPLDLIPSVRRDKEWRSKYLGRSIPISQLGNDFNDARTHASWTLFLQHIRIVNQQSMRRMHLEQPGGVTIETSNRPWSGVAEKSTYQPVPVYDRALEDASTRGEGEYGICIRFEPCTWDDLPDSANGLTGLVPIRDLAVFLRLLGLDWSHGPFLPFSSPKPSDHPPSTATTPSPIRTNTLQAAGNTLTMAQSDRPQLRYEQRDATPPLLQRSRQETFIIHPATTAMFYGHILPDPLLLPALSHPIPIDGEVAWAARTKQLWLNLDPEPRPSLANCLLPLCSAIISSPSLYPVRVPKPHHFIPGPFARPKISSIFRCNLTTIPNSRVASQIAAAIDDLETYSPPPSPSSSAEREESLSYWKSCQGASPAWCTALSHPDHSTKATAEGFLARTHAHLSWIQSELAIYVNRSDSATGPYSHFYLDLVASFLDFVLMVESGELVSQTQGKGQGPFLRWRQTIETLFDRFDVIEEGVRRRGRRRALMRVNGVQSTELGEHFDVVVSCQGGGYEAVSGEEVREAGLAMVFRAMLWHRCHYMDVTEEPFRPGFYTNIQQAMVE